MKLMDNILYILNRYNKIMLVGLAIVLVVGFIVYLKPFAQTTDPVTVDIIENPLRAVVSKEDGKLLVNWSKEVPKSVDYFTISVQEQENGVFRHIMNQSSNDQSKSQVFSVLLDVEAKAVMIAAYTKGNKQLSSSIIKVN